MDALVGQRREGTVSVRDGRVVGFAEWGDPHGRPVVMFHGGPGSRLLALGCEEAAERLGLRLVCLERPGFGLSDFAPDRTVIGWTDDVADAIRGLELDRPAIVGVSAGSPYALACAARLPLVVSRVGVIGGLAPAQFRAEDPFTDLVRRDRHAAEGAVRRHFESMAADIEASVGAMSARAGPDQAIYSRADVQERFRRTRREAFREGIDGAVLDLMLLHQPWGFELHDTAVPIRWWHGRLDAVSPVETVRAATAGTRDLELTVYPDEGHAINFTHGVEILERLVPLT
jgi:pimeloyl-ACP methyl ester carboxylesterase